MLYWLLPGGFLLYLILHRKDVLSEIMKFTEAQLNALRYVLPTSAITYLPEVIRVAAEESVSPFTILALLSRESNYGKALSPSGPTGTGDGGHGRGLMQIDDRSWGDWLARNDWTNPYVNIKKGVQILKGKIAFLQSRGTGQVMIPTNKATVLGVNPGSYIDPRPLPDGEVLPAALAAYNSGEGNVLYALAAGKSPDVFTAGGNYGSDVLKRAQTIAANYQENVRQS